MNIEMPSVERDSFMKELQEDDDAEFATKLFAFLEGISVAKAKASVDADLVKNQANAHRYDWI